MDPSGPWRAGCPKNPYKRISGPYYHRIFPHISAICRTSPHKGRPITRIRAGPATYRSKKLELEFWNRRTSEIQKLIFSEIQKWIFGNPKVGSSRERSALQHTGPTATKRKKVVFFAKKNPNRKTRAESHAIDATRHLYALQYPVWNLSRLQMIHGSSNLALLCAPRRRVWSWPEGYRNFNR